MLLPVTLIALVVGTLAVLPWISFISDNLRGSTRTLEKDEAYYAADAGVQAVVKDLLQGLDALAGGYTIPSVTLNGFPVTISISAPTAPETNLNAATLADPDSTGGLATMGPNADFLYEVQNVQSGTQIKINWAFTPSDNWRITVFQGSGTGGPVVQDKNDNSSPATVTVLGNLITGGTYTIRFRNTNNSVTLTTTAFNGTADPERTWVKITAFKSYLITSTAGSVTLRVLARVTPGPNQSTKAVEITSWEGLR